MESEGVAIVTGHLTWTGGKKKDEPKDEVEAKGPAAAVGLAERREMDMGKENERSLFRAGHAASLSSSSFIHSVFATSFRVPGQKAILLEEEIPT